MNKSKRREPLKVDSEGHTELGRQMLAGGAAFIAALESGESIERKFTVRTVVLQSAPREFKPDDVKAVRARFHASQAVFADFLGVSAGTLQSWEQGLRPVPGIASRYLDDLIAFPQLWERRTRKAAAE